MDYFNNHYRKYLGLNLLDDSTICKEYEIDVAKYYVYFKDNKIIKILKQFDLESLYDIYKD